MHSSRATISVLRVRDLKHPFEQCVFAADFGSWKDLRAECFLFTAALISSPAERLRVP